MQQVHFNNLYQCFYMTRNCLENAYFEVQIFKVQYLEPKICELIYKIHKYHATILTLTTKPIVDVNFLVGVLFLIS